MPAYVATYDLGTKPKDPHAMLLQLAPGFKWKPTAVVEQVTKQLPNTTLVGSFDDIDAAEDAFRRLVRATTNKLESPVTVTYLAIVRVGAARIWDKDEFKI